jgi:hypothetical protein
LNFTFITKWTIQFYRFSTHFFTLFLYYITPLIFLLFRPNPLG